MRTNKNEVENLLKIKNFLQNEMILEIGGRTGYFFSNGKGAFAHLENHKNDLLIEVHECCGSDISQMLRSTVDCSYGDGSIDFKPFDSSFRSEIYFEDSLNEFKDIVLAKMNEIKTNPFEMNDEGFLDLYTGILSRD